MRRCAVSESRESGQAHLRGVVVRVEDPRVVIKWGNGSEELVSRRRAQTFADAFRQLPPTHDFRRRKAPGSAKKPRSPVEASQDRKKRRSDADPAEPPEVTPPVVEPSENAPAAEPPEEPERPAPSENPDEEADDAPRAEAVPDDDGRRASEDDDRVPATEEPAVLEEEPSKPVIEPLRRSKVAIEELRRRKADPEQKVEWHGGRGFGMSAEAWVNIGDGKYKTRLSVERTGRRAPLAAHAE